MQVSGWGADSPHAVWGVRPRALSGEFRLRGDDKMMCRDRITRGLWVSAGLAILVTSGPAAAQTAPANDSLVQDPQQGATPRPLPVPPAPSQTPPAPISPTISVPLPFGSPLQPAPPLAPGPSASVSTVQGDLRALPAPVDDPLALDPASDPVLQLARAESPMGSFQAAIGAAVRRNPALDETLAQRDEAEAARNEARTRQHPVADVALTGYKTLSRAFSDDRGNILESSRPRGRTDATLRVQQLLFDFGANRARVEAGNQRLLAASAGIEDTSAQIALRAISAWYSVYGYRALVTLSEAFVASQRQSRGRIETRIAQGAAARGDVAQVDSYIASAEAQLADLRRALANAMAQYTSVVGAPPPPDLGRAPPADTSVIRLAGLATDAATLPTVRAAQAVAKAAARDAAASLADLAPQVTGGIDAGRYGLFENRRDHDVRANLTLAMRFGGGGAQRADQAKARANGADARYRQTLEDARRDASVALSDVEALEDARRAIEANYIASRRSRDVLVERFRVSRGTIFDVLSAESNYFGVAARYIQTVIELDISRYALLARTGRLLGVLTIDPATLEAR